MTKRHLLENPPKYENLTDKTSLEHGILEELTALENELQTLVRNIGDLNESFVGRMKRNALTWEDVATELEEMRGNIKNTMEFILEKFD